MTPGVDLALHPGDNIGHFFNDSVSTLNKFFPSQAMQGNDYRHNNKSDSRGLLTIKDWRSTQPVHGSYVIFSGNFIFSYFYLSQTGQNYLPVFRRSTMQTPFIQALVKYGYSRLYCICFRK